MAQRLTRLMFRGRLGAMLLLSLLLAETRLAAAQSDEGAPLGYREAIAAAIQEYEAASYAEAREQFRRAHQLSPSARTLRGLGMTEYELHNYPQAVRYLEQSLASDAKPLEGAMRRDTEEVLQRARGYVGTLELEVEPPTAQVLVDNHRVELAKTAPLLLSVGDHIVDVRSPGRLAERRAITVQGGERHALRIVLLEANTGAAADGAPTASERPNATPVYKRWWLWTAVAVVAGGAATAAILLTRREVQREVADPSDNTPSGVELSPYPLSVRR
jgi:tetratricopeptide (TPR) repeat protein